MLEQIFINSVKKDFSKNIKRIAKLHDVEEGRIQIRLKFGATEEKPILYAICKDYRLVGESTFKEIMDVRLDIKGQEMMLTPVLYEAMKQNCIKHECSKIEHFSAFLFLYQGVVGVSLYDVSKCLVTCAIEDLFA